MARRRGNDLFMMLLGALLVAGLTIPDATRAETVVRIGGTGSALGTMRQLAEAFARDHAGVKVLILPSLGSTAGIKALLSGGLSLAVASRPLTESEQQQGAMAEEYARSPLVFITNGTVDKKDLTTQELEGIYSSRMPYWSDGSRIRLILRPEKDFDTKLIRGISPAIDQAVQTLLTRPGMIIPVTDQEATAAVTKTPGALGWATLTEIISNKVPVKVLSFNGVQPSSKTIADRSYPLIKSLYLVTTAQSPAGARQFAAFVRSPAGRAILERTENLVPETH